jgi:hypothetical protein
MNCFSSGVITLYQFDIGSDAPTWTITAELTLPGLTIKAVARITLTISGNLPRLDLHTDSHFAN